jgi:cytochrome P450
MDTIPRELRSPSSGHIRIDGALPSGPAEPYSSSEDLLGWMQQQFERYGDLYSASIYGARVYVVSAPEYATHVLLENWRNYERKGQAVKRLGLTLGNGLISSNGAFWVNQRRMVQPAFNRQSIGALAPLMQQLSAGLREQWKQAAVRQEQVNLTRDVSLVVLEVTLRSIFGEDYARVAPDFRIIAEEARNLEFARVCKTLRGVIIEIAERRRREGVIAQDILGLIMQSRDRERGEPMPDLQLAREAMTLVIAGHETTASVLNWTWYLLSQHSQVEARLSLELERLAPDQPLEVETLARFPYTQALIEEALRCYPPLWLITRKAVADDYLGDYFVPAGTEIYISPYLVQRHPAFWEAPERFDPDRFDPQAGAAPSHRLAQCPFGAGPRNCIGEFMARIEMQIHLMTIARELRLQRTDTTPPAMVAGVNLLSKEAFMMSPRLKGP